MPKLDLFLSNLARQFIPNRVVEVRPRDSPWFNSDLRKLKRNKDRTHRKAKNSQKPEDWANFCLLRNQYSGKLREAEYCYRNKLASSLKDTQNINPKKWWHVCNQFLGKKNSNIIPPMSDETKTYFSPTEKANAFNVAFLAFSKLNCDNIKLPDLIYKTDNRLDNVNVTEREVLDVLKSLDTSKATGPDGVSARMLKETSDSIAPSLHRLISQSLDMCQVPNMWKEANVLPLHKKGNKSDFSNYRPISLLSIVSKVCEKLIFKNVYNYVKDHMLITLHQSGFTAGDSTVHQLLYLYDTFCKALDDKKDVRIIFCDQSKAFDRVWHKGLLYKLNCIGIVGPLNRWFSDYLTNRRQRVSVDGVLSEYGVIEAGVPQGSILGPLLFLIHINDITDNIQSGIKLFADDTSLFLKVDNIDEATSQLNTDLQTINSWAKQWLVTFNPDKTKSLFVTLKKNINPSPLTFDGHRLEEITKHKHLGITLNSKLTWSDHVDGIVVSANKKLNMLARMKSLLDRKTLLIMYESFIRPSLEYGNILMSNSSDADNDRLESIQRRAARVITGGTISTSVRCLYEELAMETLVVRRQRNIILFFHKMLNNNVPPYLLEMKPSSSLGSQTYNLRQSQNIAIPKCRLSKYQKSFLPHAITLWNGLENHLKQIQDYDSFKLLLAEQKPMHNALYYLGNRKLNIIMARLRMNCSDLRSHLYKFNLIDSPRCPCGHEEEDLVHFFFVRCIQSQGLPSTILLPILRHSP